MKLAERIPLFFYNGVFFRIKHRIILKGFKAWVKDVFWTYA